MARKSKRPPFRQADPARAARIRAMRQGEQSLHAALEGSMRAARELGDRVHYDRLLKEACARTSAYLNEIQDLLERERIQAFERCILANHELRRECETLDNEFDRLEGRPPKWDLLANVESFLGGLPLEQANALRFVLANASGPAPPAPETTDAFDKCRAVVERLSATVADVCRETTTVIDIITEAVRRGWAAQSDLDSRRTSFHTFSAKLETAVPAAQAFLDSSLVDYESLVRRRHQLRQTLATLRPRE